MEDHTAPPDFYGKLIFPNTLEETALSYWRQQYTKRKFALDIGSVMCASAMCRSDIAGQIRGFYTLFKTVQEKAEKNNAEPSDAWDLIAGLTMLHHNKNSRNPVFQVRDMILRALTYHYLETSFINKILRKNAPILQSLAKIAGIYGYYVHQLSLETKDLFAAPLGLLKILEEKTPGERLKKLNLENYSEGNAWPIEDYQFIRLHEEETFWKINYKDINGDSFFENEENDVKKAKYIYLYISKGEIIDIKSLHERIIHAIGRGYLNTKIESGDKSLSNIQLKIPKKKYILPKNSKTKKYSKEEYKKECSKSLASDALKIVREITNAYYFFGAYYPKNKEIYDEIQKEAIQQHNDRYTQQARAVGIWLWDLMKITALSWDDSIQILRESPLKNHIRAESLNAETYSEHYAKLLRQDYQLACLCVNAMEYLSPKDIDPNKTDG